MMEQEQLKFKTVKVDSLRVFVVMFGIGLILTYLFSWINATRASELYLGNPNYGVQFAAILSAFAVAAAFVERGYAKLIYPVFFIDAKNKRKFATISVIQTLATVFILCLGIYLITDAIS